MLLADQKTAGRGPGLEAAVQRLGRGAKMAKPGGHALAEFQAALAHDSRLPSGVLAGPVADCAEIMPDGSGEQTRVEGEIVIRAHVDDGG